MTDDFDGLRRYADLRSYMKDTDPADPPSPLTADDKSLREALLEWLDVRNSVTDWTGPADWTAEDGYNAAIEEVEAILEGQQVAPGLPSYASPAPAGLDSHRLMRAIEAAIGSDTIEGWGVGPLSDAIEREYEEGARE